jgi:hypothetical protein
MSRRSPPEVAGMLASPRCGARTRRGTACRCPAVAGKTRCRMHGGALGSGAPLGNQNALRHGRFSAAAIAERRWIRQVLHGARQELEQVATNRQRLQDLVTQLRGRDDDTPA